MSRELDPVLSSCTVQQAAKQMAELDVGAVVIGTADGLEGILTDRDIIHRVVVEGRHPAQVPVREVMSADLFSCRANDPVETVFAEMRERQIRRMPVYDENGIAIGIVTLSDLAKAIESPETLKETLREISEPHRSRKEREKETETETSSATRKAGG
jgi:CBS domain-containing protein